jgi:hypothetical protein
MCWRTALLALAAWVGLPALAEGGFGRFLPTAPFNVGTRFQVSAYQQMTPVVFDNPVVVNGQTVGTIRIDYATFTGRSLITNNPLGGVVTSGGFYLAPGFCVDANHTLAWAQVVNTTVTGANNFNLPQRNAGRFPDAFATDAQSQANGGTGRAPAYPGVSVLMAPPMNLGPPTLGFNDIVPRLFRDGVQSWRAELGLICIDNQPDANGVRQVNVLATFVYGFDVGVNPNTITAVPPSSFGAPSGIYLFTLNDYYKGMSPSIGGNTGVATDLYHFQTGQGCFTPCPEPSSMALMLIGAAGTLAFRMRKKASLLAFWSVTSWRQKH